MSGLIRAGKRDAEANTPALVDIVVNPNSTPVSFNDGFGEEHTQTRAFGKPAGGWCAVKTVKNEGHVVWIEPGSLITDTGDEVISFLQRSDDDFSFRRILDRIGNQV